MERRRDQRNLARDSHEANEERPEFVCYRTSVF
jgi:hypothetical protein